MKTIRLTTSLPDEWVQNQQGKRLDDSYYNRLIDETADVLKPDGSPLLMLRKGAIPLAPCIQAHPALRDAGSHTNEHRWHISSQVIGYYDLPTCRKTHFTKRQIAKWGSCIAFIRACNSVYRHNLPSRYAVQRSLALRTSQKWIIADTAFTSVTVNTWNNRRSAQTPVHVDDGDLLDGFGVISVLSSGNYEGGYLIFPKYQVAVDLRTTDVLLCDVHEYHANAPIVGEPGWERIACIFYYRTKMQHCKKETSNGPHA